MKQQAKSSNSKVIAVDITRDEKLKLLHSMGIEFPPSTRLPDHAIEKKFRGAIDASQSFEKLILLIHHLFLIGRKVPLEKPD